MGEKMSLQAVRDYHLTIAARHEAAGSDFEAYEKHKAMADAIDAHLTQPAQAVDVGAIREVIAEMRHPFAPDSWPLSWLDKLTRALPNANGKEGWGPKYTAQPCHCLTMAQREYCINRFKCSTVTTQSTPPQPEE